MSRPHLGDLSRKLFITFLEISLIEKSLLNMPVLLSPPPFCSPPADGPVVEVDDVGRTKVNRLGRRSSPEFGGPVNPLILKLGLEENLNLKLKSFHSRAFD